MPIELFELDSIAGKFNISNEEAERIAAVVDTEKEFITVWEHSIWWKDGATLVIDMDEWPKTWKAIKHRLKSPKKQIETGWLRSISESIDEPQSEIDSIDYELRGYQTISGNPEYVQVPVVYKI